MNRMVVFILIIYSNILLLANDIPSQVLKIKTTVNLKEKKVLSLEDEWRTFVNNQRWGDAKYYGGVMLFENRNLIVSSGSAFVKVSLGQAGWIESRINAFEQAELNAKIKIIRFLSENINTSRALAYLENASWKDGDIKEIKKLNSISQKLENIKNKTLDLTEASLDKVLKELDPDYDAEKYSHIPIEKKYKIFEQRFKRHIKSMAFKTAIGITPVYNNEAKIDSSYQVIVGVVWSPKLNRLAQGLFNKNYTIKKVSPNKSISEILKDSKLLLSTYGTRITIDENGDFIVLAYAQAAPRQTSQNRHIQALYNAKEIASNRARALIVNFIKEGLFYSSSEKSKEVLKEFSDQTVGVEILRSISRKIEGEKISVNLRGLYQVKEWAEKHPITGQWVAGVVVAWSPSSMKMSQKMEDGIRNRQMDKSKKSFIDLSSVPVNTSAY